MHVAALARTDDPAKAIAVHAQDPQLAFIAGGTDLLGLIKDRAALPERLLDINHLPDMARIEALQNGGSADRRARPHERPRRASGSSRTLSGCRGGAVVRRIRTAAQHGVDRWQHHAAHALRLFPRRRWAPLQQAASWLGLLGSQRHQSQSRHLRVVGRLRRYQCFRCGCGIRRARCQGRRAQPERRAIDSVRRVPSPARRYAGARQCPRSRRPDRRDRSPGQSRGTRLALPQGPRSSILRVRACIGSGCGRDGRAAHKFRHGWLWAVSRTSPGGSAMPRGRYGERRWTTLTRSGPRSPCHSSMLVRSPTTHSRSSLRNAPPCARCKSPEHAHERHRAIALARRRSAEGDRRRPLHGRYSGRRRRARGNRPQHDRQWPDGVDRHRCRRKSAGCHCDLHLSQHAAHESDAQALEPSSPARTELSAAPRRPDSLRRPADRPGRRGYACPSVPRRDVDRGSVRGGQAEGIRPATSSTRHSILRNSSGRSTRRSAMRGRRSPPRP